MGYRSDVRIITSKDGYKKLQEYDKKYLKEHNYNYGSLLDETSIKLETNNGVYIGWNNIKWYEYCDDYVSVNSIMSALSKLADDDYSYRYTRIGENYDDIEEVCNDSETREDESYLEFPSVLREFEDNYTMDRLKENYSEDIEV